MSHRDPAGRGRDRSEEVVLESTLAPDSWRAEISAVLGGGGRFLGLYGVDGGVRALFADDSGPRLLTCRPTRDGVPSVVDLIPAAAWDEREAHDSYGVLFPGHEPLRPLLEHDLDLTSWTVPVHGHDPFQVAVGPIHAGVIESGHFRFHVVGERILHLDVRLFYKHRGLERAAQGRTPSEALRYAQRACGACAVSNSVAFAHAYESAAGLWPTGDLARARTVLVELERLYNHLNDIGAACAGVGFALGTMTFAALKERVHRLNARLAGHRFLFDTVRLGESRLDVDAASSDRARQELLDLAVDARRAWHEVLFNASVQDRFVGVGLLSETDVLRMDSVGPAARAAGVASDVRIHSPRLAYPGFAPAALRHPQGDVASRVNMRALEVDLTLAILDDLLAKPIGPAAAVETAAAQQIGVGIVESPRGRTVCVLEIDGHKVERLHLRTASYANWPGLAHAIAGTLLPDFPLINKSFELCYACSDR